MCRPITNPVGALFGGGNAARDAKADAAWIELVRGMRRRGPAAKSDSSIAAALSRLTDADGGLLSPQDMSACACHIAAVIVAACCPHSACCAMACGVTVVMCLFL